MTKTTKSQIKPKSLGNIKKHIKILDFDVKRRFFRQELDKIKEKNSRGDMAINVSRNQIFDDSFRTAFNLEINLEIARYVYPSFDFRNA